jgi:ParB family chromosome partitioning protein
VTEAAGANAAAPLSGLKKEGSAAGAEQLLAESGWLPRCLRTQPPAGRSRGMQEEQQAAACGGDGGREYESVDADQVD